MVGADGFWYRLPKMVYPVLEFLPLLLVLIWFWRHRLARVDVQDAIAYWRSPVKHHPGFSRAAIVLRYLRETYGSGLYLPWLDGILLASGITGAVLDVLVAVWIGIAGSPFPVFLNIPILLSAFFVLFPILILASGSWRKSLLQRRRLSIQRIFGSVSQARAFAESVRNEKKKSGSPSLWAFPMGGDGIISRFDTSVFFMVFTILVSLFFHAAQADKPYYLLLGVVTIAVLLVLPVNIIGFSMAFGRWKDTSDMTYPIAIFLDDIEHFSGVV